MTYWFRKANRYLMTMITGRWRVTIICWRWWALSAPESSSAKRNKETIIESHTNFFLKKTLHLILKCFPGMWLTGSGYEVEETFFREQRVFQPPEVELKNARHRVDVMISLIIHQWILSYRCNIHVLHLLIIHFTCHWCLFFCKLGG